VSLYRSFKSKAHQTRRSVPRLPSLYSKAKLKSPCFFLQVYIYIVEYCKGPKITLQYPTRHTMIYHCDRRITHIGDLNIFFVLLNTFWKFLLHLECYFHPKGISNWVNRLNSPKDISLSVSLRKVICLSQWFISQIHHANHFFLANHLHFMVKVIDKAIVINVKTNNNERKSFYSSNHKEGLICWDKRIAANL